MIVQPSGSGSARITVEHAHVEGNTYGIFANGARATGTISMAVTDSVVANNAVDGISSYTLEAASRPPSWERSSSVQNGNTGIVAICPNASVVPSQTLVTSNVYSVGAAQGGSILSYQNNEIVGNLSDLAPTGGLSFK